MKAGWKTKKLGEIIQLEYGKPLADSDRNPTGLYPAYGANGIKDRTDKFYKGEQSIIVGRKGSAGEVTLTEKKYWPLDVTYFLEFDRAKYELQYLYFLLLTLNLPSMAKGVKPGINRNDVYGITVTTPDIEEQRRIVSLLDEAFADIASAKANAEKNLQNARELFDSHLDASFGQRNESWTEKALQDIGSTQTGSTPKTSDQANYGNVLPFIKPGDFASDGTLNYENDGLSAQGADSARKVSANSVLMVCIGATIGKCGYADREIATNQQINAFTPDAGVDKKFIYYQMLTKRFQDRVIHGSGQATLPIINKSKWSALTVFLPATLGEQEAIAQKLGAVREETQRLEVIYRQKLTSLDELKKSLLHQAFAGEL